MKQREPLEKRVSGEWTEFETLLFDLLSSETQRLQDEHEISGNCFLFSSRLGLTQEVLRVFDWYVDKREYEISNKSKEFEQEQPPAQGRTQ